MNISSNSGKPRSLFIVAILCFFVYYMQGLAYPSGSILSQGCILLYLLIGVYSFVKCLFLKNKPGVLGVWVLFYLMIGITFLVSPKIVVGKLYEAIGKVSTFGQYKNISVACLSMFIGYYAFLRSRINEKLFAKIGICFIVLFVIRYVFAAREIDELTRGRGAQNNAAYLLVGMIPFIPIIFKYYKNVAIAGLLLITALVIIASKRGAIVCLCVSLIVLILWYFRTTKITPTKLFCGIIGVVVLVGFCVYIFQDNTLLQERLAKMDQNGIGTREIAYWVMWKHWLNDGSLLTQLFGNGTAQSITVWGNYAHNDWLELLISNGLLGVILYASFFISGYYCCRRLKVDRYNLIAFQLILLILFLKTIFSMGYTELSAGLDFILFGAVLAINRKYSETNRLMNNSCDEKDYLLD